MEYKLQGSVLDSDSYVISEQEKRLISVVFSYFKESTLDEILNNIEKCGVAQ